MRAKRESCLLGALVYMVAALVMGVSTGRNDMPLLSNNPHSNHLTYIRGFDPLTNAQRNAMDQLVGSDSTST
jgi:hypothetical protein